jgi:hypothetical protein
MTVLEDCSRAGHIEDRKVNRVENQFQRINNLLSEYRYQMNIDDIESMIKNHNIDKLQNFASNNDKMATEFWKLLFSSCNGRRTKNDIRTIYKSEDSILVSTNRIYQSNDKRKKYKFGIVIQNDDYKGFIVNRVSKSSLKNTDLSSEEDIRNILGYQKDLKDSESIKPEDDDTRIFGDIVISSFSFEDIMKKYRNYIIDEIHSSIYKTYLDMYSGKIYIKGDNIIGSGSKLRTNPDVTSQDLKEVQNKINIREEDVRKIQKYRGIGRLSARLRYNIISELHKDYIINNIIHEELINIRSYKKEIKNQRFNRFQNKSIAISRYKEFATELIYEYPSNISYENIDNVAEKISLKTFNRKNQEGLEKHINSVRIFIPYASDVPSQMYEYINNSTHRFIVPKDTKLYCSFENKSRVINIHKGVYKFKNTGKVNHYDYIR